jgi:hypothetical protein
MATNKASLLEDGGNVQNAFPSQLVGHYERVRIRLCVVGVRDGVGAWHGVSGLFGQQISSNDERESDIDPI